jgi:hypothetical protein
MLGMAPSSLKIQFPPPQKGSLDGHEFREACCQLTALDLLNRGNPHDLPY